MDFAGCSDREDENTAEKIIELNGSVSMILELN